MKASKSTHADPCTFLNSKITLKLALLPSFKLVFTETCPSAEQDASLTSVPDFYVKSSIINKISIHILIEIVFYKKHSKNSVKSDYQLHGTLMFPINKQVKHALIQKITSYLYLPKTYRKNPKNS